MSDNISINNGCLYALSGSGKVGIGTTSPRTKLDVVGTCSAFIYYDRNDEFFYLDPSTHNKLYSLEVYGPVQMRNIFDNTTCGDYVHIDDDGKLGVCLSSKRFKENIKPLQDDFSKILEAQPVAFTFKKSKEPGIGFIAEDLDELGLRNLVTYDTQGRPRSIRYELTSLYLLEVLKDQANSIKELKAENEASKEQLKTQNQSVNKRLDALERIIQQSQLADVM